MLTYLHLAALDTMLRENRTLDEVGWSMWSVGYRVTDGARQIVLRALNKDEKRVDAMVGVSPDAQAERPADQSTEALTQARSDGCVSDGSTSNETDMAVRVTKEIMLGIFDQERHDDDDYKIIARGLGLDSPPPDELGAMRRVLSQNQGTSTIKRVIEDATNEDLELWRNEIRALQALMSPPRANSSQLQLTTFINWSVLRNREHTIAVLLLKVLEELGHPERKEPPLIQALRKHPGYTPALGM